ncbi:MAG: hypothetical protein NTY60_11185 [Proteobacteria bacterium]|nr:hypothetical protein [Pseudomonadota bacterium]
MNIIFLIYGFSFWSLGFVAFLQQRIGSRFKLFGIIWLLAAFGIIHGSLEWMDLWTMLLGVNPYLNVVKPFFMLVSYLFLVEFGRRLVRDALALHSSLARWLLDACIHIFLLVGILVAVFLSDSFLTAMVIWLRYLLGFTGSMLAGIGFLLYYRFCIQSELRKEQNLTVKYACYAAAFGFITYAVFGGLMVPGAPWFPAKWLNQESFLAVLDMLVPLFRAGCLLLVAISVTHILLELRIHELSNSRC